MATINVSDFDGLEVAIEKPLPPGRVGAASSRPVALSVEDAAALAAILAKIIAAPATEAKQDTANTSLATIAGADFATQVTAAAQLANTITLGSATAAALGAPAGAAVITDANGTVQQYLRGLVARWANALGAGTAAAALRVTLASDGVFATAIGGIADAAWASGSGSVIALLKGIAARFPAALGGTTAANSWPVVLSSDGPFAVAMATHIAQFPAVLGAGGGLKANLYDPDGIAVGFHGWQSNFPRRTALATNNLISVKASAGHLGGLTLSGIKAAKMYVRLFNKVTVAMGTDVPKHTFEVPASAGQFTLPIPQGGLYFDTGISLAITGADADASSLDNTALVAGDFTNMNVIFD